MRASVSAKVVRTRHFYVEKTDVESAFINAAAKVPSDRERFRQFPILVGGRPSNAGKGRIMAGYNADLTVVGLNARRTVTGDWLAFKCGWSPFTGREFHGWPVGRIVRRRRVMLEDEVLGAPEGEPVRFHSTPEKNL